MLPQQMQELSRVLLFVNIPFAKGEVVGIIWQYRLQGFFDESAWTAISNVEIHEYGTRILKNGLVVGVVNVCDFLGAYA